MIVGTGIDITEVARIAAALERHGERFLKKVFTAAEIEYCRPKANAAERFAARFAAKEAAMKALGTGWRNGIAWRECEVQREPSGRPNIVFHGRAADRARQIGVKRASLSLTHTAETAMAQVILED